ncbi:hypothetical protein ElyMa_002249700 [Elysia marginata]|uniref:Uncharacterized protein n=1 Tax=Elysia marginata TaxID=1093978 RepID=A0AAV4FWU7_9GAST|nr:hypothetical protein ElyMa_002249700 [Elysia marginata]
MKVKMTMVLVIMVMKIMRVVGYDNNDYNYENEDDCRDDACFDLQYHWSRDKPDIGRARADQPGCLGNTQTRPRCVDTLSSAELWCEKPQSDPYSI